MQSLERLWNERNRTPVLIVSGSIILAIAVIDWRTEPYISLGFLYLFPIMFAAAFLPRWWWPHRLGLRLLAESFAGLPPFPVRVMFIAWRWWGAGCSWRTGAQPPPESRFAGPPKVLVETSPAAIVTVDERGFIELANAAAVDLLARAPAI